MKQKFDENNWERNVSLKEHTSFKIGGRAKYFCQVYSEDDLIINLRKAKSMALPIFILGGGSNLLISDKGYPGLIIQIKASELRWEGDEVFGQAGASLSLLVHQAEQKEYSGLEWAVRIPGTIGGAIRGNAGSFDGSMAKLVKEVMILDQGNLKKKKYLLKDCEFDYRDSIFRRNHNLIVLSVVLKLAKGNAREIAITTEKNRQLKQLAQPHYPSAGSVFKNPTELSAGKLIEEAGLKGRKIGQAQVSLKHANFIINLDQAKSEDVRRLIILIQKKVKEKFNVILEKEIEFL